MNHTVCVINDNGGTKWPFICSLASLHSVALHFLLCVYVSRYYLSGLMHYTKPWRCFSGQRPRPKMPRCCCYHDNLGKKNKKNLSPTWSKMPASSSARWKLHLQQASASIFFFCLLANVLSECSLLVNLPLDNKVICQTGGLVLQYIVNLFRSIYFPRTLGRITPVATFHNRGYDSSSC